MKIVVGIPTKNEAATIQHVASVIDAGLSNFFAADECWIVNADNDSTDGTRNLFLSTPTYSKKHAINTGSVNTGKGTNVLATFEFAMVADADCVVFIDGDVRSVEPQWVATLVEHATKTTEATFVTPQYVRNRYEANTTNQLVRPFLQAAFGLDISQPIGGEFAMNKAFVQKALTWPRYDSTNLYGIDVWLTVNAALDGCVMQHVEMGRKVHNPTFPKIFRLGEQVLDTLFHLMMEQRPARPVFADHKSDDLFIDEEATRLPDALIHPVLEVHRSYVANHWARLTALFPILTSVQWQDGVPRLTTDTWAHLLADAYEHIEPATFRAVRDAVVGLFPARVITYWQEIEDMDHAGVETLLKRQNDLVVEQFLLRTMPQISIDSRSDSELLSHNWEIVA